jgi:hypothetical protein
MFDYQEAGKIYSHHQKTVIVDADAGHHKRKIMAFVGGLDLSMGRYDTPKHPLFRTLQTVHKDDYHNPNFTVNHSFNLLLLLVSLIQIWNLIILLYLSYDISGKDEYFICINHA